MDTDILDTGKTYTIPEFLKRKGLTIKEGEHDKVYTECFDHAEDLMIQLDLTRPSTERASLFKYPVFIMEDVIVAGGYTCSH